MKIKLYRGLPACLALYLLSAVLCRPSQAASWLVDGQTVQRLEIQVSDSNADTEFRTLTIDAGSNPLLNGSALLQAYATAQKMAPALDSEVTIVLPPARYDLGDATLVMDTEYINLCGAVPITLVMPGEVQVIWEDYDEILDSEVMVTNYATSAVLTGEMPKSIITSSGVAISNTSDHASIRFIKIDGEVFTSAQTGAVWQDVWFSSRVDYGATSSNTFIRVHAPLGICATKSGSKASFLGRMVDSIVTGSYCLGGSGGTIDGTLIGNTISGTGCVGAGAGGIVKGIFTRNTIMGEGCVGSDSGFIDGIFIGNTIAGMGCVGGTGGTINGTFSDNTILGMSSLGWDSGTVNASFIRNNIVGASALGECTVNASFEYCTLKGPWQLQWGTISFGAVFAHTSGLHSDVTNSAAKLLFCIDHENNPLPNQ